MKYVIQCRETGELISEFSSMAEAKATLNEWELEDKRMDIYTPNFYEIVVKCDWEV